MKRLYEKPKISVEDFQMDQPFALNCVANKDDMEALISLGYFNDEMACSIKEENILWGSNEDTICYHSNVQQAFLS